MKVERFAIDIPQAQLDDLQNRLRNTRFPDEAQNAGWSNGTDLSYMKDLVGYWQHKYDWRKHEASLNQFAQFKTTIDGVEIHFIHERSKNPAAKALILTHGWPDSFYRFHKIIPMLTDAFHVIVPSVPGFGFSERKSMSGAAVADLWAKLMTEALGYRSFLAAGGDIGAPVTKALAARYKDVVKAVHLTDVGFPTGQEDRSTLSQPERDFIGMSTQWVMTEGAYLFVQGNKPQSLAYGLNDSPVGLAAWIASFANGGQATAYADAAFGGRDEFLTNAMIYWFTETAGSSARMYREEAKAAYGGERGASSTKETVGAPAAIAVFPYDAPFPREWAQRQGLNVQRFVRQPKGGHFAALEVPELYASDLREAFSELAK
jgi:pimeloyl-ACP methyl ester carboxylesterase